MKKILLILLCVLLSTGLLVSCNGSPQQMEAYSLYQAMNEAVVDVTSIVANSQADMVMTIAGETFTISSASEVQQIIRSETEFDMAMFTSMDMSAFGMGAMETTMYYRDGWLYMDLGGTGMKFPLPIDALAQFGMETDVLGIPEFTSDAIVVSGVEEVGNNNRLHFTLSGAALSELMDDTMGDIMNLMGVAGLDMDITYGDMSFVVYLDESNLPIEQHVMFSIEMTAEGEIVSMSADISMSDVVFNTLTSINFPPYLDNYVEGSW